MENDDNLFVKIMILILFLTGLLVGLAISSGKEYKTSYNRQDSFLTSYNSPLFIKSQTLASMSDDIDVVLLAEKIIQCESNWNPNAKNPSSSAYGLGQVIDGTFNWFQEKYKIKLDRHNPKDQMYIVVKLLEDGGYNHWAESSNFLFSFIALILPSSIKSLKKISFASSFVWASTYLNSFSVFFSFFPSLFLG